MGGTQINSAQPQPALSRDCVALCLCELHMAMSLICMHRSEPNRWARTQLQAYSKSTALHLKSDTADYEPHCNTN